MKGLDPKTYAAGITFKGDAKYDGSAKEVNGTVKKATPKINFHKLYWSCTDRNQMGVLELMQFRFPP